LNLGLFQTFLETIQEPLIRFFVNVSLQDCSADGSCFDHGKKIKRIKYFFLDLKNIYKKNKDY